MRIKKQKIIKVKPDFSNPILDFLCNNIDAFLTRLLDDDFPRTYFVEVTIGNDHPRVVTIPVKKVFRGRGPPLDYDMKQKIEENKESY